MANRKNISANLGKWMPFFNLRTMVKRQENPVFLPFYHGIGDATDLPHIQHLYKPSNINRFVQDLEFILRYFKPISLIELMEYKQGKRSFNQPVFHLSFDDGLRQVYEIALPILEQKGIPCSLFFNTDCIDNQDLFFRYEVSLYIEQLQQKNLVQNLLHVRSNDATILQQLRHQFPNLKTDFLSQYQPYMTTAQIQDTIQRGFTIGGHSQSHPYFHLLDVKTQLEEANQSIQTLVDRFNLPYKAFAFPFSDDGVSMDFFKALQADISFGTAGIKQDSIPMNLQRVAMERQKKYSASHIIRGEYIYHRLSKWFNKDRIVR